MVTLAYIKVHSNPRLILLRLDKNKRTCIIWGKFPSPFEKFWNWIKARIKKLVLILKLWFLFEYSSKIVYNAMLYMIFQEVRYQFYFSGSSFDAILEKVVTFTHNWLSSIIFLHYTQLPPPSLVHFLSSFIWNSLVAKLLYI